VNRFTFPAHTNCAPQFVGLKTQCTTPETTDSHIKLINNLIIFDANKHLLYPSFLKIYKEIIISQAIRASVYQFDHRGCDDIRCNNNYMLVVRLFQAMLLNTVYCKTDTVASLIFVFVYFKVGPNLNYNVFKLT